MIRLMAFNVGGVSQHLGVNGGAGPFWQSSEQEFHAEEGFQALAEHSRRLGWASHLSEGDFAVERLVTFLHWCSCKGSVYVQRVCVWSRRQPDIHTSKIQSDRCLLFGRTNYWHPFMPSSAHSVINVLIWSLLALGEKKGSVALHQFFLQWLWQNSHLKWEKLLRRFKKKKKKERFFFQVFTFWPKIFYTALCLSL